MVSGVHRSVFGVRLWHGELGYGDSESDSESDSDSDSDSSDGRHGPFTADVAFRLLDAKSEKPVLRFDGIGLMGLN